MQNIVNYKNDLIINLIRTAYSNVSYKVEQVIR